MYCSPQYTGKNCTLLAQVTSGITVATGTESGPNTICAFQEGDTQYPCDPGCCKAPSGNESGSGETDGTGGTDDTGEPSFPIWAIILLIVLGTLFGAIFLAWAAKKMSRKNR